MSPHFRAPLRAVATALTRTSRKKVDKDLGALVEGTEWDAEGAYAVGYVAAEIDAMFKYPERHPNQMPNIHWALQRL